MLPAVRIVVRIMCASFTPPDNWCGLYLKEQVVEIEHGPIPSLFQPPPSPTQVPETKV